MRSFLLILAAIICSCTNVLSTDHFWIGGIGDWDDGSNWSHRVGGIPCNCVPTDKDHVEITNTAGSIICTVPNGHDAYAESIDVQESTTLRIGSLFGGVLDAARLIIADSQFDVGIGLKIDGTVEVDDSLMVYDAPIIGIHITPKGTLNINSGGVVLVGINDGLCERGILNQNLLNINRSKSGTPGELIISNIMGDGLSNSSAKPIYNDGIIQISNLNHPGAFEGLAGIRVVKSDFLNDTSGVIMIYAINQGGDGSGIILSDSASFTNDGSITVYDSEIGIDLQQSKFFTDTGYREIINRGEIIITDSISLGMVLSIPATLENYGEIVIRDLIQTEITAFENNGVVNNHSTGKINIHRLFDFLGFSIGLDNKNSFMNEGIIEISDIGQGLSNSGEFENFNHLLIDTSNIAIQAKDKSQFTNHDSIIVSSAIELGIGLTDSASFDNRGITILQSNIASVLTAISIQSGSQTTNQIMGQIMFKDISAFNGIIVNDAILNNMGLIDYQNSTFSNSFLNIDPGVLDIEPGAELIMGN